jgi:hypothetical protein
LFTIFLTSGTIIKEVGKLTANPIENALNHLTRKSGAKPKLIMVRTKDMTKDMLNDIKTPNKTSLKYFPSNPKGHTRKGIIIS